MFRQIFAMGFSAAMLAACVSSPPQTAFNGRWQADVPAQGGCQFVSRLTIDVAGRKLVGTATNPGGVYPLSGAVDSGGRGAFRIGDFNGTIDFTANTFVADYANTCGGRHASGTKLS